MSVKEFDKYVSQVQTGTSIPHVSGQQIFEFPLLIPNDNCLAKYNLLVEKLMSSKMIYKKQNIELDNFSNLLLSKLASIES